MDAILIHGTWCRPLQSQEDPFLKLFSDKARKQIMLISLVDEPAQFTDECIFPCVDVITDMEIIRAALSRHQILRVPAIITSGSDESYEVHYPAPHTAEEYMTRVSDGDDHMFRDAIAAYDAFDIWAAAELFNKIIMVDPKRESAYFNMAGIMHMCGLPTLSLHFVEQLLLLNPNDATAKSFLWSLASSSDGHAAGVAVYRRLAEAGHIVESKHRMAQLTGEVCMEADNEYLKEFYDQIAVSFESKLVMHLGYRGPWVLYDMVSAVLEKEYSSQIAGFYPLSAPGQLRILDLGCGSGLCGRVFGHLSSGPADVSILGSPGVTIDETLRTLDAVSDNESDIFHITKNIYNSMELFAASIPPRGAFFAGIDISANMVKISSNPINKYSHLVCGHLVDGLHSFSSRMESLDLVVAADTFIYVGALGKVFELLSTVLKRRGIVAFSTELLEENQATCEKKEENIHKELIDGELIYNIGDDGKPRLGFKLMESARFGHLVQYIEDLCSLFKFDLVSMEKRILRTESSLPVSGMFYVLQRKED